MLSKRDLQRYRAAVDDVVGFARQDLKAAFDALIVSGFPVEDVQDMLVEVAQAVSARYGDMAATVAADWYMELRPDELGRFVTQLAEPAPDAQVEGSVRWASRHLPDHPERTLANMYGFIQRFIENCGRDTITLNGGRDRSNPRFARVPSRLPCAFCAMLASRGFVYKNEITAGSEGQYHDDCRCVIVPGWGSNPSVDGYNPEKWLDVYEKAFVHADKDATLANMRREAPDMFRDGVTEQI